METLWFWLLALMLAVYVILDGFDLGAGILHMYVARTERERRGVILSVGPVWDGNEVWILAVAGTALCIFPTFVATALSGLYLPIILVAWFLIGRVLGIEFRHMVDGPRWRKWWDISFSVCSGLLALFFGVALGNLIRGVPLGQDGTFTEPLVTDFSPMRGTGVLDWYTVSVGILAVAALASHGGRWIALKTEGDLQVRARRTAGRLVGVVAALTVIVTALTFLVQAHALDRLRDHPLGGALPLLALGGLAISWWGGRKGNDRQAFLGSAAFLGFLLATAAFGSFPYLLPASTDPALGLTVAATASGPHGLRVALAWWIPGMILVAGYFTFMYTYSAGKVRLDEGGHG